MPTFAPLCKPDERLIRDAIGKAGGSIHAVVGLTRMDRSAATDTPAAAAKFERALRRFVATGNLR